MLAAPPYTCAKTSRHAVSHAQRQYDAGGASFKALTLEPRSDELLTAEELANLELLIDTTRPLTSVVPQEENDDSSAQLQAYAPM